MVGQLRKREQSWHGYSRAEGESFPWSQGWKKAQKIGRCVRSRRQQKLLVPIICYAHCKERTALRNDVGIELGGALRNETEKNIVLASVNAPAWIRLGGGFATRECKIVDVSSAGRSPLAAVRGKNSCDVYALVLKACSRTSRSYRVATRQRDRRRVYLQVRKARHSDRA